MQPLSQDWFHLATFEVIQINDEHFCAMLAQPFVWRFSSSYQKMPLRGLTWTNFSNRLFPILLIYCWLWINLSSKVSFSHVPLTESFKIIQFYFCGKLPSSWFFHLQAENFYLFQSLQFFLEIYSMAIFMDFFLFRTLDSPETSSPPNQESFKRIMCNEVSSFTCFPPPALKGHYAELLYAFSFPYKSAWAPIEPDLATEGILVFLLMIPAWKGKIGEAQVGLSLLQSQHVLHLPCIHFQSFIALCKKFISSFSCFL